MSTRLKNFVGHTGKIFYITIMLGATVNFELPQSEPELVVNYPS